MCGCTDESVCVFIENQFLRLLLSDGVDGICFFLSSEEVGFYDYQALHFTVDSTLEIMR